MKYDVIIGKKTYSVEISQTNDTLYELRIDGDVYEVDARSAGGSLWTLLMGHETHDVDLLQRGDVMTLSVDGDIFEVDVVDELRKSLRDRKAKFDSEGPLEVLAPMPGKVVKLLAEVGAEVKEGDGLVIVEAMKMENVLKSTIDGVVKEVFVQEGQAVESRVPLVTVEPHKTEGEEASS